MFWLNFQEPGFYAWWVGLAVSEHKVLGFLVFLLLALGVVCVLSLVPGLGWTAHSFSALLLWKVACVLGVVCCASTLSIFIYIPSP